MNSDVILHILEQSSQGFTPFEILDRLMSLPQYRADSRGSLFSELLSVLQNLRNSQLVTQVSSRWVLLDKQENTSEKPLNECIKQKETESVLEQENNHNVAVSLDSSNLININDSIKTQEIVIDAVLDVPIEKLNLLTRTYNSLKRTKINRIRELKAYSEEELLEIRNFGQNSLADIRSALAKFQPPIQLVKDRAEKLKNTEILNDAVRDCPIYILNLSSRTYNCLKEIGINTLSQLKAYSKEEENLLEIRGFGKTSLAELRSALANFQPTGQIFKNQAELPEWFSLPGMQISTDNFKFPSSRYINISKYPTVSYLIEAFEAGEIALDSEQYETIKDVITPFQALRDASDDYLNWLGSLSHSTLIEVLTKLQWTPDKLKELSPIQILSMIPSDACEITSQFIISGKINSKTFLTIAEEINSFCALLNEPQKIVFKQRLFCKNGSLKSLAEIAKEIGISRERVRQIEFKIIIKRDSTFLKESGLFKIKQVAIEALYSAGCLNTFEQWCQDIAEIYPPGEIDLPSVMNWIMASIPGIHKVKIGSKQIFYVEPFNSQTLENIKNQITEFWKKQRISKRSQLQEMILPFLPEGILNSEQVADTLINTYCHESIPGIFSAAQWDLSDFVYYVLYEAGKALHFSEIAQEIKKLKPNWNTDNCERSVQGLISRHPEIIRSGSGIYGLREWGTMKYGHFREVLLDYLSKQPLPVNAEDIYADLSKSYAVTPATISMNLSLYPNLFKKFGRSNFYGIMGRRYELPEQNLINLLVAKLQSGPVSLSSLEEDADLRSYTPQSIYLYLNVSPLFCQTASNKERNFALSIKGKGQYEPGDLSNIIRNIVNQIREPLHVRDFLLIISNYYAYPPGESTVWKVLNENKDYLKITEAIFILREWMSDEALSPILEDLDQELFRKIVLFTVSSKHQTPTSETLFNWLNFCYKNRFFYRGSLIYAQINPSKLSEEKAREVQKIGKVCQRNGDISGLVIEPEGNSEELKITPNLELEDLRQQAQSAHRTTSEGLGSKPDGKYRIRYVGVGVEVYITKWGGKYNPCARVLEVLVNSEPYDPLRHNPISNNTATLEQRQDALQKLYSATLTAYAQIEPYLQVSIGPRHWGSVGYRHLEPLIEEQTGDVA